MYEDEPHVLDGTQFSERDRVLAWTKDVAKSTAKEAERSTAQAPHSTAQHIEREPPRLVVDQIVTTPAVVVTRVRPESTPKGEISTKVVIGTVLGATAGATVADAMSKSQTEASQVEQQTRVAYRPIEAPVAYELVQTDSHIREHSGVNSRFSHYATAAPQLPYSHIDDLNPQSKHSHHVSRSITRSHVERVTSPANATKISVADSGNLRASHTSSHGKTARQSDFVPITEMRSVKDMPLPYGRVTSLATEETEESKAGKPLVFPKESLSQVSTRRWGESGRSKHYGGRNLRSEKDHEQGNHRSRTSKK